MQHSAKHTISEAKQATLIASLISKKNVFFINTFRFQRRHKKKYKIEAFIK